MLPFNKVTVTNEFVSSLLKKKICTAPTKRQSSSESQQTSRINNLGLNKSNTVSQVVHRCTFDPNVMSQTQAAAGSGWSCRSLSWCSDRARTPPERSDITTPAAQKKTE